MYLGTMAKYVQQRWLLVAGVVLGCGDSGSSESGGSTSGNTGTGGPADTGGVTDTGDSSSGPTTAVPTTTGASDSATTTATTTSATTAMTTETTGDATSVTSGDETEGASTGPAAPSECDDGIDNDGDGFADWQFDFGCYGPADQTEAALPRDQEDGFTTYEFGPDSLVIYVSNDGDDAADGLTPATAVATITHAAMLVRDGEHDFMLLRRGDVWRDQDLYRFKSGKDGDHPLIIGGYGDSMDLPRIEVPESFIDHDGKARSNVALIGLHFVSSTGIVGDPDYTGAPGEILRYVGSGTDHLVEGCHFEYGEVNVQTYDNLPPYDGIEYRRNVIERAFHKDTCLEGNKEGNFAFRPSGLYASHVHHLTIEGNLFDHNGWNPEDEPTACATVYNHNMYLNGKDIVIRDNFLARPSSMHIKMRSDTPGDVEGLLIENNFFVEGEIGIGLGGNTTEQYRFVGAEVRNNVLTDIGRSQPTTRTLAWSIDIYDNDKLTVADNLVLNNRQPGVTLARGFNIEGLSARDYQIENNLFWRLQTDAIRIVAKQAHTGVVLADNLVVDPSLDAQMIDFEGSFAGYTFQDNQYHSSAPDDQWFNIKGQGALSLAEWTNASKEMNAVAIEVPAFPDPERDAEAYAVEIGEGTTLPDLLAAVRLQTRLNWRTELSAPAINTWIRAGFGR